MPYTSGTFSLYTPGNPVVTGTTISSTWANNTLNDIASGLSTAVLKDGTQTITANIPMNGFGLTQLASLAANGGTSISLTNGQLAFPATQNPSTNVNTLDDYEEGTFTPAIVGATTPGTQTYTIQVGDYVKVGKLVTANGYAVLATVGATASGSLQITGLPFTAATLANQRYYASTSWSAINMGGGFTTLKLYVNSAQSNLNAVGNGDNVAEGGITTAALTAGSAISFCLTYLAAT